VALVSRAFGAKRIFMTEVNPEIKDTLEKINTTWGGDFEVEMIDNWKDIIRKYKGKSKIIHLTMYGQDINTVQKQIQDETYDILVVVGAEKVPREIYDIADYNISIGTQPHSEISALAILLDRIQKGKQFDAQFLNAQRRIIPQKRGKNVTVQNPKL
jgi:tRNA (cytidine56-2'-O)-methyltransferase